MPSLDNASLAFAFFLVACTLGAAKVLSVIKQPLGQGSGCWGSGVLILGLGFYLLSLPDRGGQPHLGAVSNVLITVGLALIAQGIHRFLGRHERRWLHLGAMGLAGLFLLAYLTFRPGSYPWGLGALALAPLLLGDMSLVLWRVRDQRIAPVARFTALVFGLMALGSLLWGGYALSLGETPDQVAASPYTTAIYSLDLMVLVASSLGLMLMSAGRLEEELAARNQELEAEVTARRLAEEHLARQAGQDFLTGLANRRKFFEEARKAWGAARRHGRELAVVMFDLDHFKLINDKYGHPAGDEALKALARAFLEHLRVEDSLARFGGEEFILLLPESGLTEAVATAERLRALAAGLRVDLRGEAVALPASFGVSGLDPADQDIEDLLARADQALYCAKGLGRNRTCLHPGPGAEPVPVDEEEPRSACGMGA